MRVTVLELKYCECCGSLGVRRHGDEPYCQACAGLLADMAFPDGRSRPKLPSGLPPKRPAAKVRVAISGSYACGGVQ